MIGTITIKQQQLEKGFFTVGDGSEVVLIMGSCRVAPYVNYLTLWNEQNGNRFTIHSIDPFNWNWNEKDERVDYEAKLRELETYQPLLDMLKSVDIFIHEFYMNAGMFNVERNATKKIYNFGLAPKMDICLPNLNDVFILTRDIVAFNPEIRKMATADYNVTGKLSEQTLSEIDVIRQNNLQRLYNICSKTSFPEFAEIFATRYKVVRLFWTFNHISKHFSQTIFHLLNKKFLKLDLSNYKISQEDLYANNYTYLSEYDEGYKWGEEIKPLRESL